jgi:hypothetical protein
MMEQHRGWEVERSCECVNTYCDWKRAEAPRRVVGKVRLHLQHEVNGREVE